MNAFFIIPAKAKAVAARAVHGSPAAREAPRRARRDRAARWAARSPSRSARWDSATSSSGARSSPSRRTTGCSRSRPRRSRSRRARAEAGRRGGASPSSRSRRATSTASTTTSRSCSRPRRDSAGSKIERKTDTYGFEWVIVRDPDFEDHVDGRPRCRVGADRAGLRRAAPRRARSASRAAKHPVYWIYGFKRGAFWPFIPTGDGQKRDNAPSSS